MDKIVSEKQLGTLIMTALRSRPATNGRLMASSYRLAIEEGRLCYAVDGPDLVVAEKRPGFELIRLWAAEGEEERAAELASSSCGGTAVLEAVFKPDGSPKGLAKVLEHLEERGFHKAVVRRRMSGRVFPAAFEPVGAARPREKDLEPLLKMLLKTYDPVTGCVPTESELRLLAKEGLFVLRDGPDLTAMVHYTLSGKVFDATHLIVDTSLRGQGIAGRLMAEAMGKTGCGTLRLWVNDINKEALQLYDWLGLEYDGMLSLVFRRDEGSPERTEK